MKPITEFEKDQVRELGERRLIERISQWLGSSTPPSPYGIGDDAAVIKANQRDLVIAVDSLVFHKHFDESTPPHLAGAKLLKRNISDLAAMGAKPTEAVIACLIPENTSIDWLKEFYQGLRETAETFAISIIGGDITSTCVDLAFTLTLVGQSGDRVLTRKSGRSGDTIWVTGSLGGSIKGKHLEFDPRLKEGSWLSSHPDVTSGMDISDGLATDLLNLCPDDCRVEIKTNEIPLSDAAKSIAKEPGENAIEHALTDGEDYELVFTLDHSCNFSDFLQEWNAVFDLPITRIGVLVTRSDNTQERISYSGGLTKLKNKGYEHF
jgi:thiamine-monophosphate kinase